MQAYDVPTLVNTTDPDLACQALAAELAAERAVASATDFATLVSDHQAALERLRTDKSEPNGDPSQAVSDAESDALERVILTRSPDVSGIAYKLSQTTELERRPDGLDCLQRAEHLASTARDGSERLIASAYLDCVALRGVAQPPIIQEDEDAFWTLCAAHARAKKESDRLCAIHSAAERRKYELQSQTETRRALARMEVAYPEALKVPVNPATAIAFIEYVGGGRMTMRPARPFEPQTEKALIESFGDRAGEMLPLLQRYKADVQAAEEAAAPEYFEALDAQEEAEEAWNAARIIEDEALCAVVAHPTLDPAIMARKVQLLLAEHMDVAAALKNGDTDWCIESHAAAVFRDVLAYAQHRPAMTPAFDLDALHRWLADNGCVVTRSGFEFPHGCKAEVWSVLQRLTKEQCAQLLATAPVPLRFAAE
jgi:hypothetical protein